MRGEQTGARHPSETIMHFYSGGLHRELGEEEAALGTVLQIGGVELIFTRGHISFVVAFEEPK